MAITVGTTSVLTRSKWQNKKVNIVDVAFSGTYATNGFEITAANVGLFSLEHCVVLDPNVAGYLAGFETASNLVKLYNPVTAHTHAGATLASGSSAAGSSHNHNGAVGGSTAAGDSHNHAFTGSELATHQHAAITAGTPAGSVAAPTFTGTTPLASLNLATPVFSGTGLTAAGQVMTTTDNQTMTLNQCAGMWLLPATAATPPMLIVSNTAVTGAPAVLTVIGAAATDAGAYKIVTGLAPVGTNSAPAFTGSELATHQHAAITAGTPAGTNAAEATHTHAATGLTSTNTAEATHTHGVGTLTSATSGAATVSAGSEVAAGTNVGSQTLTVIAIGI